MNADHRPILLVGGLSLPVFAVAEIVRQAGYCVPEVLENADEILAEVESRPYELVLIDEIMVSGPTASQVARSVIDATGIPIVFFGSGADRSRFHSLREVDPFGFLLLPLTQLQVQISLDMAFHRLAKERERTLALPGRLEAHHRLQAVEGLLPLCAGCKKITTDDGRWLKLEEYFARHANVHFTHSLCPECEQRLYGVGKVAAPAVVGETAATLKPAVRKVSRAR